MSLLNVDGRFCSVVWSSRHPLYFDEPRLGYIFARPYLIMADKKKRPNFLVIVADDLGEILLTSSLPTASHFPYAQHRILRHWLFRVGNQDAQHRQNWQQWRSTYRFSCGGSLFVSDSNVNDDAEKLTREDSRPTRAMIMTGVMIPIECSHRMSKSC